MSRAEEGGGAGRSWRGGGCCGIGHGSHERRAQAERSMASGRRCFSDSVLAAGTVRQGRLITSAALDLGDRKVEDG